MRNWGNELDIASGLSTHAALRPSHAQSQSPALRTFLMRERKWPPMRWRLMGMTLAVLGFSLMIFGKLTPSPRFALGDDGRQIVSSQYDPLRRASDWFTGRKYAVLTFDDGPDGHGVDQQILDVLRKHHAHAMFFVVCNKIDDDTSTIIERMERDGHVIGNHSFDHPDLARLPSSRLTQQIEECSRLIARVTGHRPHYFRPPFGSTTSSVAKSASDSGMEQMLWNANSLDVATKHPEKIVRYVSLEADDASVILMHQRSITVSVLDRILTDLEQRGFTFVLPEPA